MDYHDVADGAICGVNPQTRVLISLRGLLFILKDLFLLFAWLMIFCTREFPLHSPDIFNFLLSLGHIHCPYPHMLILIVSLSSLTLLPLEHYSCQHLTVTTKLIIQSNLINLVVKQVSNTTDRSKCNFYLL